MKISIKKNKSYIIIIAVIVILLLAIIFTNRHRIMYLLHSDLKIMKIFHINPRGIKRYIRSYGKFASLVFVLIYSLKPILFIVPASLLSIIAGGIFGAFKAFILSMIGCFFSASLAFLLARSLGKPFVDKLLKGKALKLYDGIEKHGFIIMLLMRLSFIFPYDPLSYAAGLTVMSYKDFILGTIIGIAPEMISYSFMGRNLNKPFSIKFFLPIILIIVVASTAAFVYKKYKDKNDN